MKRISLLLLMLAFASGVCFAQAPAAPMTPPMAAAPKAPEVKTVSGKIDAVTLADAAKGTKSEITVVDDAGKKDTFLVKSTTTIYDADWKAITLDKLNKDEKIKVKFTTTAEGVNEASSLHLVK